MYRKGCRGVWWEREDSSTQSIDDDTPWPRVKSLAKCIHHHYVHINITSLNIRTDKRAYIHATTSLLTHVHTEINKQVFTNAKVHAYKYSFVHPRTHRHIYA